MPTALQGSSAMKKNLNNMIEFCFLAEPTDINFGGKVHGGMVMKWVDQASYACAAKWSKRYRFCQRHTLYSSDRY